MNRNTSLAQAIGASFGLGANAYLDAQDQARIRAQQDSALKRQTAVQNFELARTMAPGLIASNPEAAANLANASTAEMRAAGFNLPNVEIKGGLKEITRPGATSTPGPFAVTPQAPAGGLSVPGANTLQALTAQRLDGAPADYASMMTQGLNAGPAIGDLSPIAPEKVTERDFSNPQTKAAIAAAFGLGAAQRELLIAGGAIYDPSTGEWKVPPTHDAKIQGQMELLEKRLEATAAEKQKDREVRVTIATTREAGANGRAARRGSGAGRGGYDDEDPQDVSALETRLLKQAKEQASLSMRYPVDKVDKRGRPKPDGIADGMNIPMQQAVEAYNTGVQTLYQRLRAKHGLKAED